MKKIKGVLMRSTFTLSYSQIEGMLCAAHDIPPKNRGALMGRVKRLKRLDFPTNSSPGKGRRSNYSAADALKLLLVFELYQFGIQPEKAVQIMRWFTKTISNTAGYGSLFLTSEHEPDSLEIEHSGLDEYFILFDPIGLASLSDQYDDGAAIAKTFYGSVASKLDRDSLHIPRRLGLINTTGMLRQAAIFLRDEEGITSNQFGSALREYSDSNEWHPDDGWIIDDD